MNMLLLMEVVELTLLSYISLLSSSTKHIYMPGALKAPGM